MMGVHYIDIINSIVISAELKDAYLIAVSVAFIPSLIHFIKQKQRENCSNWPTPFHLIRGCNLQLNGAMGLAILVTQPEIITINFLVMGTPSNNLEFVILAHFYQYKIYSFVPYAITCNQARLTGK